MLRCEKCEIDMERDYSNKISIPKICKFPLTLTNVEVNPVTFKNKKHLIKYCREHNYNSGAL